jgi:hypothetical protein
VTEHLLVIGGQRCGTTYLRALLDAHPEITMARPARPEPKFFCSPDSCALGLEEYHRRWFAHRTTERVLGDKSTSYLEDPEAPRRAAAVLGEPHVIAVLRDPVERAVSNWRFSTDHGFEERPLETALKDNLVGATPWNPANSSVSPFAYLERGRYLEQLQPWFEAFPATTHVCFSSELVADGAVRARLFRDLGVGDAGDVEPPASPVNSSTAPAPDLSPWLVAELREYYASSDSALAARLGRALPWPTRTEGART